MDDILQLGSTSDEEAILNDFDKTIVRRIQADIASAEAYQASVVEPTVKQRYEIYYADKDYYRNRFPILSKTSDLVSTDVADTIEWALPSLMKVFTGSDEVITIAGVTEEDDTKAETMQELLVYQLQRQNKFFPILYNWMKDALITGMGIIKCYWERTEGYTTEQTTLNNEALQALQQTGVPIVSIEGPDIYGDFVVTYQSPYYVKNAPKIENILVSDFIYSSDAKSLEEANFVAQKRKVTMSYLREREAQGVYANIDEIKTEDFRQSKIESPIEQVIGDKYNDLTFNEEDKARLEVVIYECYTKMDINGDGILEDMIITICGDTIIRIEQNYMGRHPFFTISPTKDPHRIWVKRSYAELIGELQDLKVALTRQIMHNVALNNDPKMLLAEDAINIDDYIQGRKVIRMKSGHSLNEVAMPMPVHPLSPQTFQFLEYIEGQKENRTGITRYNQGLDANSLNKTATGISAILGQSSQRLELIARMFAETGIYELFRFMVSLNQKFIDQNTVIRLTNKSLKINPEDLNGNFDLVVNAGISIATKESTIMATQTLLTALMQANAGGYMVSTPENIYNLFKKWIESIGFKNYGDYITDPAVTQQRMMMEMQLKQQVLSQLPPQALQYYAQFGILPPEVLLQLPPELQLLFKGAGDDPTQQQQGANSADGIGGGGFGGTNLSQGLAGGVSRVDNQSPQIVPRGGNGPVQEPPSGIGGF
ncbi:poly(3-hydroxybutyrate) depolymerase [Veillonella sp. VA139]|uniref:portal protein n=1 Tax=Veillonella sp. VA139 TaxID=741830 RepID=UPI000F8CEB6C|nr:poly(3-hydroxybutyrate) depolymerase [Veillonella sp. VA139]